jgi:hypothetical protein
MKSFHLLVFAIFVAGAGSLQAQHVLSEKHLPGNVNPLSLTNNPDVQADLVAALDETIVRRINTVSQRPEYYRRSVHPTTGQERYIPLLFDADKQTFVVNNAFVQGGEKKQDKGGSSQEPTKSDSTQQQNPKVQPDPQEPKQPTRLPRVRIAAVFFG